MLHSTNLSLADIHAVNVAAAVSGTLIFLSYVFFLIYFYRRKPPALQQQQQTRHNKIDIGKDNPIAPNNKTKPGRGSGAAKGDQEDSQSNSYSKPNAISSSRRWLHVQIYWVKVIMTLLPTIRVTVLPIGQIWQLVDGRDAAHISSEYESHCINGTRCSAISYCTTTSHISFSTIVWELSHNGIFGFSSQRFETRRSNLFYLSISVVCDVSVFSVLGLSKFCVYYFLLLRAELVSGPGSANAAARQIHTQTSWFQFIKSQFFPFTFQKLVRLATFGMIPFTTLVGVFVMGSVESGACLLDCPWPLSVVMAILDLFLSSSYLFLFLRQLRDARKGLAQFQRPAQHPPRPAQPVQDRSGPAIKTPTKDRKTAKVAPMEGPDNSHSASATPQPNSWVITTSGVDAHRTVHTSPPSSCSYLSPAPPSPAPESTLPTPSSVVVHVEHPTHLTAPRLNTFLKDEDNDPTSATSGTVPTPQASSRTSAGYDVSASAAAITVTVTGTESVSNTSSATVVVSVLSLPEEARNPSADAPASINHHSGSNTSRTDENRDRDPSGSRSHAEQDVYVALMYRHFKITVVCVFSTVFAMVFMAFSEIWDVVIMKVLYTANIDLIVNFSCIAYVTSQHKKH